MARIIIKTEQDKDVVLEKRRAELDSLSISINESKKELEGVEKSKKDKIKELAHVVKTFDDNDTIIKNKIDSIKSKCKLEESRLDLLVEQVNHLLKTKKEVEGEIDALKDVLAGKKAQIDSDTLEYEKDATKKSKALAKLISDQQDILDNLSTAVNLLIKDKESLESAVANGKAFVSEAYKKVNELEKQENELESIIKQKTQTIFTLSTDIEKKDTVLTVLGEKEEATQEVIVELNKRKDALLAEVTAMEKERSDFYREKLAFQEVKQLILVKEIYIKERFEQAGIKY